MVLNCDDYRHSFGLVPIFQCVDDVQTSCLTHAFGDLLDGVLLLFNQSKYLGTCTQISEYPKLFPFESSKDFNICTMYNRPKI